MNEWHLTQDEANRRFAWIPPVFATLGGFFGGWLAFYWIRRGVAVLAARMRVCWISAASILLATAAIPADAKPAFADSSHQPQLLLEVCISTNLYALPIDMFGPARAAFGVSALTFAYGLMRRCSHPRSEQWWTISDSPAVCVTGSPYCRWWASGFSESRSNDRNG